MDSLNQSITNICLANPNTAIWICGDMNLPDIDWETEQITSHQYRQAISESYLRTLAKVGLEQVVNFPTRRDNILDLISTNRPTLVRQCQPMPGLSDHEVIFTEIGIQATKRKPVIETQQSLDKIVRDNVPSKMTSSRLNQCWFDTSTKRMCRKKNRAYKKAKSVSGKSTSSVKAKAKAWDRYRNLLTWVYRFFAFKLLKSSSNLIVMVCVQQIIK